MLQHDRSPLSQALRFSPCLALAAALPSFALATANGVPAAMLGTASEAAPLLGGRPASSARPGQEATLNETYRLGSEWGKRPVSNSSLAGESPAFRRAALATARAGGATSFYLGTFGGEHIMATNHHVFPSAARCLGSDIRFPLLGLSFKCQEFLGTWDSIDLSLFVIKVDSESDAKALAAVGANFDFASPLKKGQPLLTLGFGVADNPTRALVGNKDSDCKVFSEGDTFRLMSDPDRLNPGTYDAWSFANGCDVSHGDSGSALVDRATGKPIGIIWTGRIPKAKSVQSTAFLDALIASQGVEIWEELSYGVPAAKMKERLELALNEPATPARTRGILESLLAD
jgi:hypothetical protein